MGLNILGRQNNSFTPILNDTFVVKIKWNASDTFEELPSCIGFTPPQPKWKEELQTFGNNSKKFLIPDYDSLDDVQLELLEYSDLRISNKIAKMLSYLFDFDPDKWWYLERNIYEIVVEVYDNMFKNIVYTYVFRYCKITKYNNYDLNYTDDTPVKWTISFNYMYYNQYAGAYSEEANSAVPTPVYNYEEQNKIAASIPSKKEPPVVNFAGMGTQNCAEDFDASEQAIRNAVSDQKAVNQAMAEGKSFDDYYNEKHNPVNSAISGTNNGIGEGAAMGLGIPPVGEVSAPSGYEGPQNQSLEGINAANAANQTGGQSAEDAYQAALAKAQAAQNGVEGVALDGAPAEGLMNDVQEQLEFRGDELVRKVHFGEISSKKGWVARAKELGYSDEEIKYARDQFNNNAEYKANWAAYKSEQEYQAALKKEQEAANEAATSAARAASATAKADDLNAAMANQQDRVEELRQDLVKNVNADAAAQTKDGLDVLGDVLTGDGDAVRRRLEVNADAANTGNALGASEQTKVAQAAFNGAVDKRNGMQAEVDEANNMAAMRNDAAAMAKDAHDSAKSALDAAREKNEKAQANKAANRGRAAELPALRGETRELSDSNDQEFVFDDVEVKATEEPAKAAEIGTRDPRDVSGLPADAMANAGSTGGEAAAAAAAAAKAAAEAQNLIAEEPETEKEKKERELATKNHSTTSERDEAAAKGISVRELRQQKTEEQLKAQEVQAENIDTAEKAGATNDEIDELAYQMMRGNMDNGKPRKDNAKAAGYTEEETQKAQDIVNEKKWDELKARHDERVAGNSANDQELVLDNVDIKANDTGDQELVLDEVEIKADPKADEMASGASDGHKETGGSDAADAAAKAKAKADVNAKKAEDLAKKKEDRAKSKAAEEQKENVESGDKLPSAGGSDGSNKNEDQAAKAAADAKKKADEAAKKQKEAEDAKNKKAEEPKKEEKKVEAPKFDANDGKKKEEQPQEQKQVEKKEPGKVKSHSTDEKGNQKVVMDNGDIVFRNKNGDKYIMTSDGVVRENTLGVYTDVSKDVEMQSSVKLDGNTEQAVLYDTKNGEIVYMGKQKETAERKAERETAEKLYDEAAAKQKQAKEKSKKVSEATDASQLYKSKKDYEAAKKLVADKEKIANAKGEEAMSKLSEKQRAKYEAMYDKKTGGDSSKKLQGKSKSEYSDWMFSRDAQQLSMTGAADDSKLRQQTYAQAKAASMATLNAEEEKIKKYEELSKQSASK